MKKLQNRDSCPDHPAARALFPHHPIAVEVRKIEGMHGNVYVYRVGGGNRLESLKAEIKALGYGEASLEPDPREGSTEWYAHIESQEWAWCCGNSEEVALETLLANAYLHAVRSMGWVVTWRDGLPVALKGYRLVEPDTHAPLYAARELFEAVREQL